MKKVFSMIILIFLIGLMTIICISCSKNEKYDVVCTIYPQYDFCKQIAGEELKIKMLLPVGTDAHNYQLKTGDKMAIKNSKVFVYNGGESEQWVEDVKKSTDLSGTTCLELMDLVDLIPLEEDHDPEHTHTDGHEKEYDEHVYLSIRNAVVFCNKICQTLCDAFPDKKEFFISNCDKYVSELLDLDTQYEENLAGCAQKTMYFADRYPFAYLARDYGLQCVTPYKGCSTDRELTLKQKTDFKNAYHDGNARGVFILENGYEDLAKSVVSVNDGKIFRVHSCQTLSKSDLSDGKRYVDFMKENLVVLTEALA